MPRVLAIGSIPQASCPLRRFLLPSMNGSLLRLAVELRPEESRCSLQNVVGSAQFSVFTLQPLQLSQLVAGRPNPPAGITLGLANPVTHRLWCRTQFLSDRSDRFSLRPILMLVVQHHPDRPLTQLGRVSPMSCHSSILSRIGASTRPGVIHGLFADGYPQDGEKRPQRFDACEVALRPSSSRPSRRSSSARSRTSNEARI